mmetsp:Transcript_8378/g.20768  ORF Transcript_8378/g.20768 Transcript_8378/m.20768 type:complete len:382 (-) Transcript_8378:464-1609(-)
MLPKSFTLLDKLPLNANGKVLRGKLPAPDLASTETAEVVLPATSWERQIAALFAKVLDLDHTLVSVTASFFDMGGNSLTALQLLMLLRQECGVDLGIAALFESPTVAQVAKFAGDAAVPADPNAPLGKPTATLFSLQPGTVQTPPHFLLHGAGASGIAFRPLVAALGDASRPTFALEDPSLNGSVEYRFESILQVAEVYGELVTGKLREMGVTRCAVSGWSYGGVVAVEVVRALEKQGFTVDLLTLFDAPVRAEHVPDLSDAEYAAEEGLIREGIGHHMGGGLGDTSRWLTERALAHFRACTKLLRRHRTAAAPQLACEVVHFVAESHSSAGEPEWLNAALKRRAELVPAEGSHWTMLTEGHAGGLGKELGRRLARSSPVE